MTTVEELDDFYTKVMSCDYDVCSKAWNDSNQGFVPHGFYYESPTIDILVVGKNPEYPGSNERYPYSNKSVDERMAELKRLHAGLINGDVKLTTFHRNLFGYCSYFLDLPVKQMYTRMAHTHLFKCSTIHRQETLSSDDIYPCFNRFFLKELRLFRPRIIFALGGEVEKFLTEHNREIEEKIGSAVLIKNIKHPSYDYNKDDKWTILSKIKDEMYNWLNSERKSE
ncbi:MAG: hypothetical protein QCI00_05150 [Candidatus Thermoplasmatota archaeon]|nr:hypothetical protein [Candidatus Thermoplasmatota archaeon]